MSENAQETQADGTVTVALNGNGAQYDCFVSIGGAQFRFATFPAENVDAEIAETNAERQAAAASQPSDEPAPSVSA